MTIEAAEVDGTDVDDLATPAPADPAEDDAAWRVILSYLRPYRRGLLAGGALSLLTSATGLALPLAAKALVGNLGQGLPITGILVAMTALVIANAGVGALSNYVLTRTAESVVLTARHQLVSHLIRLRVPAIDLAEPGDLMSRVTADTTLLREVTTSSLVGGVTGGLTMIATMVMMGLQDGVLLAVTLGVLAGAATIIGFIVPRINRASKDAQESVGVMGAALERAFGAFRTVKASGAEQREGTRIRQAATDAWLARVAAAKWSAVAGNTAGLAAQVAFLTVLAVGGARAASGAIDIPTLIAFLLYIYYLMPPIQQLVGAVTEYQVGAAAVSRIRDAQRLPVEPEAEPAPPRQAGGAASVRFHQVHFRYRAELPEVHNGVSFTVSAGGMTAFVGPSGAGKTTVFSLLERFYEPSSGQITIDGRDITGWPVGQLRAAIGYVEQDAPVLSGSLRENLLLGAPHAGEDEVHEVLRTTRLDGLLARLPDGPDTLVGHRGTRLSGGERQRVAIARAL
ncbi:MAG: ABC transporter ATP-binding protein, partial [Pseudonocardiaceae bacterium]